MIRTRLETDRPTLARAVATLRALVDDADLASLDRALTGRTTEELGELRDDLSALLEQLDDAAHETDEAVDQLDTLGSPADGGTRLTIENDAPAWRRAMLRVASIGPVPGARITRVRVIVDFAPLPDDAPAPEETQQPGGPTT